MERHVYESSHGKPWFAPPRLPLKSHLGAWMRSPTCQKDVSTVLVDDDFLWVASGKKQSPAPDTIHFSRLEVTTE
eukprot:5499555-Amphidinium_carterae.1